MVHSEWCNQESELRGPPAAPLVWLWRMQIKRAPRLAAPGDITRQLSFLSVPKQRADTHSGSVRGLLKKPPKHCSELRLLVAQQHCGSYVIAVDYGTGRSTPPAAEGVSAPCRCPLGSCQPDACSLLTYNYKGNGLSSQDGRQLAAGIHIARLRTPALRRRLLCMLSGYHPPHT